MEISAIDHIYAYDDGDTLTPGMGVVWANGETGCGLQQYWSPTRNKVIATDFSAHPAILYPQPYSTKAGNFIVPETAGQQWYFNAITDEGGILSNGAVKDKYKDMFEVTTVTQNGKTFPALKIKGNIATQADHTDKTIYYVGAYQNRQIVCSKLIPIQESIGDAKKVLITCTGPDGSGDNVLSNDRDWIQFTATLQTNGETINADKFEWQKYSNGAWSALSTVSAMQEVNNNTLKLYDAGVEGTEMFRCAITYGGVVYYGTCEATDIHDPFYIEPGRSIASQSVKKGETVTYNPKVYDRSSGEVSTGWSFSFSFTDKDGNAINGLTNDNLTYDNILKYGGIATRIEASKA